ncbi:MAG: aminotransferase class I/II-fold pyridoxal phosphate-dependent enzyme [Deltaproteobacteria bacterium]|jgi:threonine-phosphate decarboxylase|nr:aminotransferase class I/II-fold pyridoxal phosphate-dependent enzyme [Deltaproteobacteria bacterium]
MIQIDHGGRVFQYSRSLNVSCHALTDFSVNLNPLGQPPELDEFFNLATPFMLFYPEPYSETLADYIEETFQLDKGAVLVGSGSMPIIYNIPRVFKPKNTVIIGPAFAEYARAIEIAELKHVYVHAKEEEEFLVTPELIEEALKLKPNMIFIANPANPTGRLVPNESLEMLLEASNDPNGPMVVIDEAFMGFTVNGNTAVDMVKNYPNIIVLQSMTKLFSVPGIRLGYAISSPKNIAALLEATEPWQVNTLAQVAGRFLLKAEEFIKKTPKKTTTLRRKLVKNLGVIRTYPSDANFVLLNFKNERPGYCEGLIEHLLEMNILVRNASNMPGLEGGYIRLAVKPEADIKKLLQGIASYSDED